MNNHGKILVSGVVLAAMGVILARFVGPRFDQPSLKLVFFLVGAVIALTGVGVVMYGIKKRAEARSSDKADNVHSQRR